MCTHKHRLRYNEEGISHKATSLLIDANPIIGEIGLQTIFNSLRKNSTMRELTNNCSMTDTGVELKVHDQESRLTRGI